MKRNRTIRDSAQSIPQPSCLDCVNRFKCGIGNANGCKGYEKDQNLVLPCETCERRDVCSTWKAIFDCGKKKSLRSINSRLKAPDLRMYARRMDEYLPIEAEWATVDEKAIRLFLDEPVWHDGIWKPCRNGTEVATIPWEGALLDGIVNLDEFRIYEDGPVTWRSVKIQI